ncbi:MAG: hypothetical protein KAH01_05410 [Caldisericia bacterium]|nr:hypothetical protein [Caldisericia bacterium]
MEQETDIKYFPEFFNETQFGKLFTDDSLLNKYALIFTFVSVKQKKDRVLIQKYEELYGNISKEYPSICDKIQFLGLCADTPLVLKKNFPKDKSFIPILINPDKKMFQSLGALNSFKVMNIKSSEPSRQVFLIRPDKTVVWIWKDGSIPEPKIIKDLLDS